MYKYFYISSIIILLQIALPLFSQIEYENLYKSRVNPSEYEIGQISFNGNAKFASSQLESIISSRATNRSLSYSFFEFTYRNTRTSKLVPKFVKNEFYSKLNDLQSNIHFFREEQATNDLDLLRQFYHQNGNHQLKVSYTFTPNHNKKINELVFILDEGQDFYIKSFDINYKDSIPEDLTKKLKNELLIKSKDKFDEKLILLSADRMLYYLQNAGYFFSYYELPQVYINTETKKDSVTLNIFPGNKYKINSIDFEHNSKGYKLLASSMTKAQLNIHPGDYYSKSKIRNSEINYLNLNLFQSVLIDTLRINPIDTSMDLIVRLDYRKQQEYNFGLFTNRTTFDKYWNAGAELTYSHRNIFNAAQVINPFVRVTFLDLSRFFETNNREIEYQFGINLSQPLLFTIDKARIGGSLQFLYSFRRVIDNLWLSTFELPFRFQVRLPRWTFINNASFEVGFRRQIPSNYDDALSESLKLANNLTDSLNIQRKFLPFQDFNSFVDSEKPFLTSTTFSLGLNGDTRNDIFSPSKGYYASFLVDIAPFKVNNFTGISRFIRLQTYLSQYFSINYQSTIAYKIKLGHIIWLEKSKSIIPYDLQFYAGGANSIRGWASRRLRYFGLEGFKPDNSETFKFLEDYIGSSSLIEGSIEYRYKIAGLGHQNYIQTLLSDLQLAAFFDFGNAYQWFLFSGKSDYPEYNPQFKDYFKGIAAAAGVGLRYESPVGIIRLDLGWKLYDPNHYIDPSITKTDQLKDAKIHISLGHPF